MNEVNKTPDAVIANCKITKSILGGDDVTIIISNVGGDEIAQFSRSYEFQDWLIREGYVHLTGSGGVWIKAPKVPSKANVA